MDITFSIKYRAEWGQKLCITGSIVELGNWDEGEQALQLTANGDDRWEGTVSIDGRRKDFVYYYFVKNERGEVDRREWKRMHHMLITEPVKTLFMDDRWIDRPANAPFYSSSFYDVLFKHEREHYPEVKRTKGGEKMRFQIYAPTVPQNMRLYLSGNTPKLGEWDPQKALEMNYLGKGEWTFTTEIDRLSMNKEIKFKFFISDENKKNIRWETCENRTFKLKPTGKYDVTSLIGLHFEENNYSPHFSGVVIPLFSLRSENDFGIGDFGSLRKAIDWASEAKLHVFQMLPINDTTFTRDIQDSYPYNNISVNAINPIYVDIQALPPLKHPEQQEKFEQRAKGLRNLDRIDYREVYKLKEEYLKLHFKEQSASVIKKRPYINFCMENAEWLIPYQAYCVLRDTHQGTPPSEWPLFTEYDQNTVTKWLELEENKDAALFYSYTQFLLFMQLRAVSEYAAEKSILLKGDIPIGVSPKGMDVWVHPELFNENQQAGAPPDDFSAEGQNWGFPTYNWEEGERNNFKWWKERFRFMSNYFQAFRVDHILGFFRIWEIPTIHRSGLLGHFNPALPYSIEEIEQYGFHFREDMLTIPLIHREDLTSLFGEYVKALIWEGFVIPVPESSFYTLNQFGQKYYEEIDPVHIPGGEKSINALKQLCTEVLFLPDPYKYKKLHPRVALEKSLLFNRLGAENRQAWRKLDLDFFFNRNNELWKQTALKRLIPMHRSTDMLVCAEDLGMIPPSVPEVLKELQVFSLELERMPKTFTLSGYNDPETFPYYSVCTTSTHDMAPLRLWWEELDKKEQDAYMGRLADVSEDLSEDYPHADKTFHRIIYHNLQSPSMLVILPLSDWMSIDRRLHIQSPAEEQINHPENPHQAWDYRMPISIEKLISEYSDFTKEIVRLLERTNRD